MADKLSLYNRSLRHVGERKLASLSENREPRRVLDDFWDSAVAFCIEDGLWNFAMRSRQMDSSASLTPGFDYTFAFQKPDDWVRTFVISGSEALTPPLLRFNDEAGIWYADVDPLFVKYVSSDPDYGGDLSRWPETFAEYVALRLAVLVCEALTQNAAKRDALTKLEKIARINARSKDAMNEGVQFPPMNTWASARISGGMWSGQRYLRG